MFPFHPHTTPIEPFAIWASGFNIEECNKIKDICELYEFQQARVGESSSGGITDGDIRKTNIVWLPPKQDTEWIFYRMNQIAGKMNYDKFQLELTNFDGFQYSKYEQGGHYKWHTDTVLSPATGLFRKLSLVLMLSDPEDYTGGDLLLAPNGDNDKAATIRLKKGEILAFYSHIAHKVQPVETGTRVTLVTWVTGPKLK